MKKTSSFSYEFWAIVILAFYAVFQIARWQLFPQHLDICYHLLTAWGFIKAGGYTSWDFWQYAPAGRPHIYPPFFHMVLAILMRAGIDKIVIAKFFNATTPVVFLFVLWNFLKKYFSPRLAFLALIAISSPFSFYLSAINHIPSTIAMIFGILALGRFFDRKITSSILLFTLCFYTHIGTSWFMILSMFIYSQFMREERKHGLIIFIATMALSMPVLIHQFFNIRLITLSPVNEKYFCDFKIVDYMLAAAGFVFVLRNGGRYLLFAAMLAGSLIYAAYPARFFSAEGCLPIALLSAVLLDSLYKKSKEERFFKYVATALAAFIIVISPTLATGQTETWALYSKIYVFDSTPLHIIFPENNERLLSRLTWSKDYYYSAAKLIKANSEADDIIYCTDDVVGLCLAALSERATANHLLSEVAAAKHSDPLSSSKIIVIIKYHSPVWVKQIIDKYHLIFIGENDIMYIYKNPSATAKIKIRRATVPFL